MVNLDIDFSKCSYCMDCVELCSAHALLFNAITGQFYFKPDNCTYCEVCLDVCGVEAIILSD